MQFNGLMVLKCLLFFIGCACGTSIEGVLGWKNGWFPADTTKTDRLAAGGLFKLAASQVFGNRQENCTLANAAVRREWTTLLPVERKTYTDAVLCLQKKPSRFLTTDPTLAPGAKSRYDDFVAVHIQNTFTIHATANFLSWHRLFTWTYEQALRNECGYKGYQPYWNWGKTAFDPINSPVFDGSAYSMSGNGVFAEHNCTAAIPTGMNCIPPGVGGGCVDTGPFKNYTVNIAPVFPALAAPGINGSLPFLSYFPRCLRRDVSPWVSSNWTKDTDSYDLIMQNPDIYWFQQVMQGNGFVDGFFGVHAGGHYTIGGDPGGDFFASPGDPAFFLHHAQIDRTWWIWQNQDLAKRQNAVSGTITLNNYPPSRNGTLDDWLEMGILGTGNTIKSVMSTTLGPLCYIYV
ncbi:tyrosinase [Bisporella sp. PMI_857]|nr:tyrosinase [Bisporella sp. PMI_857]